jgi:hypothetical protein
MRFPAASLLLLLLPFAASPAFGQVAPQCEYGEWSEPTRIVSLEGEGAPAYPWITATSSTSYLILGVEPDSLLTKPLWLTSDLQGRTVEPPGERFAMYRPQAAAGSNGSLHVVWAELDSLFADVVTNRVDEVWYAMRDREGLWSDPVLIQQRTDRETPLWGFGTSYGTLAVDRLNRAHVIFSVNLVLRHALVTDDTVIISPLGSTTGLYPAAAVSGDTVLVAFTHKRPDIDPPPGGGLNTHIWIQRSLDAGETWSEPSPVGEVYDGRVHEVSAVAGPGGGVHLVWAQGIQLDARRQVIRHAFLDPELDEWLESAPLDVQDNFWHLRAASDWCGSLHLVYVERCPGDSWGCVQYTRYSDAAWTTPITLLERGWAPAISTGSPSPLLVYWWQRGEENQNNHFVTNVPIQQVPEP